MIAVYQCGSSVILKNYRDIDYIYYFETPEQAKESKAIGIHGEGINAHYCSIDKIKKCFLGIYAYPFMKKISGLDVDLSYSIFKNREEYIECLKKHLEILKKYPKSKHWYHLLCAYYLYQNNKYEFTEDQLEHIQQVHDNGIDENTRNLIIDYLK